MPHLGITQLLINQCQLLLEIRQHLPLLPGLGCSLFQQTPEPADLAIGDLELTRQLRFALLLFATAGGSFLFEQCPAFGSRPQPGFELYDVPLRLGQG